MDRRQFLTRSAATTAGAVVLASGKTAQAATDAAPAHPDLGRPAPPPQPKSMGLAGRDFPKVGGDLGNKNYSTLGQINQHNVRRLGGAWRTQLEGGSADQYQECTVVAQGGVLYVQTTQQNVFAVNGRTGEIIWKTAIGSPQATTDMRGVGLGQGLVFSTSGGTSPTPSTSGPGRSYGRPRCSTSRAAACSPAFSPPPAPTSTASSTSA